MNKRRFTLPTPKKVSLSTVTNISINKRQRFVISVLLLSFGLFFAENLFGRSGFYVTLGLSVLADVLFLASMHKDLRGNFSVQLLVLPFLFTMAFGFFYFLIPARFITRLIMAGLYALGLYSLYLSQNIFIVASIRTIALLSGARLVSFVITLITFFFLSNTIFTLDLHILATSTLIFVLSALLIFQSIWTITLDRSFLKPLWWVGVLAMCLFEISSVLWFWPSSPTVIALFLTGFFYTIIGISHVWLEKRLFKGVIWEYIWVAVIVFCILILFTTWRS